MEKTPTYHVGGSSFAIVLCTVGMIASTFGTIAMVIAYIYDEFRRATYLACGIVLIFLIIVFLIFFLPNDIWEKRKMNALKGKTGWHNC